MALCRCLVIRGVASLLLCVSVSLAQLTTDQKLADFSSTAGLFAKGYGPLDWKKQTERFDLLDTAPWAAKVRATKTDLEFFEVMTEYLNRLNDAHVSYNMPSTFVADLNFGVDIYDGKLLVDFINRTRLPADEYPFANGYELVSIDGVDAIRLLDSYLKYSPGANPRTSRRLAADFITFRPQQVIPFATEVPEISTVVFRRYDGALETHRIPWRRAGLPWAGNEKLPFPGSTVAARRESLSQMQTAGTPSWMEPLERLWNCTIPDRYSVLNFGAVSPVFLGGLPAGFQQRLGRVSTDYFFSGTYRSEELRIGLIRIPSYAPSNQTAALEQFAAEIAFMQANTDGLIIDQMRNPGGSVAYMHSLLSLLHHYPFEGMAFEVRATSGWIQSISNSYESARAQGAPPPILALFQKIQDALVQANASDRGLTAPIPLDSIENQRQPARNNQGNIIAYTRPIMVLIDEFSASGGDAFAAVIQDNARGALFGYRTMGAGGNVTQWRAGSYSEAIVTLTESLMSRAFERAADNGYPTSRYIENVGVRPDFEYDYMTQENLFGNGKPFVDAFTAAMVEHIRRFR
jgi:hypothetical protein